MVLQLKLTIYFAYIYIYIYTYLYINSFLKEFWRDTVLEIKTKDTVLSRQYQWTTALTQRKFVTLITYFIY